MPDAGVDALVQAAHDLVDKVDPDEYYVGYLDFRNELLTLIAALNKIARKAKAV